MTREELRNNYGIEICELCCREYFTNRAYPETLCEGRYCEDNGLITCGNAILSGKKPTSIYKEVVF